MNLDLTRRWIARWEGRRAIAYDDANGKPLAPGIQPVGIPTIGVGLNLLTSSARMSIASLGLDYSRLVSGIDQLTDSQIDYLLDGSLKTAIADARSLVASFDYLSDSQGLVLTDLAFNMGKARLMEFVHMLGYVKRGAWANAAAELRNSKWFRQVGHRGVADADVLGGAAEPEAILGLSPSTLG
jgi:lysozyme